MEHLFSFNSAWSFGGLKLEHPGPKLKENMFGCSKQVDVCYVLFPPISFL